MNGDTPAILSINFHSEDSTRERYAIMLNHPDLPSPLGPPLQEVRLDARRAIDERVREVTDRLSRSEWLGESNITDDLSQKLQSLGRLLCNTFIPPIISEALKGLNTPLVISTELNNLPWELLHLGEEQFLALKVPFVRNPPVETYKPGAIDEFRRERQQPLQALLSCNPGQPPLPMVRDEVEILARLLQNAQVVVRRMGLETRDRLEFLGELANRQFTLVHFAGHGFFDAEDPANSCIRILSNCNVEQEVTAGELYQHMAGAPIFFLNTCESAHEASVVGDFLCLAERTKGFATLVISGGAVAFVGTQWPVMDLSAALFGTTFYQQLLSGARIGEAMLSARRACASGELTNELRDLLPMDIIPEAMVSQVTWANFVLYGKPHKRLL